MGYESYEVGDRVISYGHSGIVLEVRNKTYIVYNQALNVRWSATFNSIDLVSRKQKSK